ncbi:Six-hairpin glycosidase [Vararia minispora EC-137]|uniref:Six-hairpin glycosidase n=1 Tax=Vararia minispora EC-137 TaxID=1314806 RepID=A0ACB8QJW7_9AGAM|nr:Six-hairpin glycosidase [Vararia minispora EC-137]
MRISLCVPLTFLPGVALALAPAGPWDAFNFAPASRTVYPAAVREVQGTVDNASGLINASAPATLSGNGSWVALDFGIEIGGIVSMNFDASTDGASIALAWTESPLFIDPLQSDSSSNIVGNSFSDGVLAVSAPLPTGFWTQDPTRLRGGFRFLTVSSTADGNVTLSNISVAITFQPGVENLRDYTGYFYAPDPRSADADLLTKIWAGSPFRRRKLARWLNNGTIGVESPVTVDGAKRDRTVWPGDMGIAVATEFLALNDLVPTKNSLIEIFVLQRADGALPYCGPTISCGTSSITYHEWTLIGVYNYWLFTNDTAWVQSVWTNYTLAVQFLTGLVDASTGLVNSTSAPADWGRDGGGGFSISPNVLYYRTLVVGIELANAVGDTSVVNAWAADAAAVKQAIQDQLWEPSVGAFRDNTASTLIPQDGNALAVLFNVTASDAQKQSISAILPQNWQETGAVTPERAGTIAPFVGGFEIQAHWEAGQGERALDLIRLQWGYMLTTNLSVQSTLIEGYKVNNSLSYYGVDPAYTSHAHGWSTGPTSALLFYLVGLRPVTPLGQAWRLAPQLSGLPAAQGGFETALGTFAASWAADAVGFELNVTTPAGTSGVVILPVNGTTTVDGAVTAVPESGLELGGGSHTITVA